MATSIYLLSGGAMAALLIGVVVVMRTGAPWRHGAPSTGGGSGYLPTLPGQAGSPQSVTEDTNSLVLAFFLLVVLAVGTTVYALSGGGTKMVLGFMGAGLVAFLTLGVFWMGRSHGHPYSHAVAEAVITLGAVVLVVVMSWLVYTDGRLI